MDTVFEVEGRKTLLSKLGVNKSHFVKNLCDFLICVKQQHTRHKQVIYSRYHCFLSNWIYSVWDFISKLLYLYEIYIFTSTLHILANMQKFLFVCDIKLHISNNFCVHCTLQCSVQKNSYPLRALPENKNNYSVKKSNSKNVIHQLVKRFFVLYFLQTRTMQVNGYWIFTLSDMCQGIQFKLFRCQFWLKIVLLSIL